MSLYILMYVFTTTAAISEVREEKTVEEQVVQRAPDQQQHSLLTVSNHNELRPSEFSIPVSPRLSGQTPLT